MNLMITGQIILSCILAFRRLNNDMDSNKTDIFRINYPLRNYILTLCVCVCERVCVTADFGPSVSKTFDLNYHTNE